MSIYCHELSPDNMNYIQTNRSLFDIDLPNTMT